jgi:hypothetical protein
MKFTSQQRELIKETRVKINKMQAEQNELYTNLLSKLNLSERSEDWIFDYIFNQYGTIKDIEKKSSKKPQHAI